MPCKNGSFLACPTAMQELATFGFRGEALSSLCAVADVSVVTRTAEQDVGVRLRWVGGVVGSWLATPC